MNSNRRLLYESINLPDKYCSCLFKTTANMYSRNYNANPYAICSSSVFNRRGLKGPGNVRCEYTQEYLSSLPYNVLYNYALAKNIIRYGDIYDYDELVGIIYEWLHTEDVY